MGLGKTVQMCEFRLLHAMHTDCSEDLTIRLYTSTVALILSNPFDSDDETVKSNKTTLIVAPVGLLEQWKLEVQNKTKKHLRVEIYHGPKRKQRERNVLCLDSPIFASLTVFANIPSVEDT
jgi:SNF2 family DNA or RNA helicase